MIKMAAPDAVAKLEKKVAKFSKKLAKAAESLSLIHI